MGEARCGSKVPPLAAVVAAAAVLSAFDTRIADFKLNGPVYRGFASGGWPDRAVGV